MPESNGNWLTRFLNSFLEFATSTHLNRIWRAKFISTSIIFSFVMWILWWLASSLCALFDNYLSYPVFSAICGLVFLFLTIYWSVYIYNKRFHDFWKSWWWQLLNFIPIVNIVVLLILCLKAWDKEDNQYWSASETKTREKVLAWLFPVLFAFFIVWIFAAALLPRMQGVQSASHDAIRRADLSEIQSSVLSFYNANWRYPLAEESANWIPASQITPDLNDYWLDAVPYDQDKNNNSWLWTASTNWEYLYMVTKKNTINWWWFILLAKTTTEDWSNWVVCDNWEWVIEGGTDLKNITPCNVLNKWNTCANDMKGSCTYTSKDELRYILTF